MAGRIDIRRHGDDRATVALHGEHELYSAERLAPELNALLAEGRNVVIDLTRATFIDSSTVTAVLNANDEAGQRGLTVRLLVGASTGPSVRRLLELTRLYEVVPLSESAS